MLFVGTILHFILLWWIVLINAIETKRYLFIRERIGKDGRLFKLIKFRSMRVDVSFIGEQMNLNSALIAFLINGKRLY